MKVIDKFRFTLGCIDVSLGVILIIMCIMRSRYDRLLIATFTICAGIMMFFQSIETEKQRQRRKEELEEIAKMWGWYNDN